MALMQVDSFDTAFDIKCNLEAKAKRALTIACRLDRSYTTYQSPFYSRSPIGADRSKLS